MGFDAILLAGPTASGKTALAFELAELFPSEIISMDSALVYKGMDIGTAKPTKEELRKVPHHLIDVIDPEENYSAARFVEETEKLVPEIQARGRVPLIVGGTMLYAKALLDGLSSVPSSTPEVRKEVSDLLAEKGLPFLYEKLREVDPAAASNLFPGDTQRISRALEVWKMTGRPFSSFMGESSPTNLNILKIGLFPENRALLHGRIEQRFDQMLKDGFLDEVRSLKERPGLTADAPSMRCVGYRQAWNYLDGEGTEKEFREKGIAATRQLAKRQLTWLRSFEGFRKVDPFEKNPFNEIKNMLQSKE